MRAQQPIRARVLLQPYNNNSIQLLIISIDMIVILGPIEFMWAMIDHHILIFFKFRMNRTEPY